MNAQRLSEIDAELRDLRIKYHDITNSLVSKGRGEERPAELARKTDMDSVKFTEINDAIIALCREQQEIKRCNK